jgi:hypothetical protein
VSPAPAERPSPERTRQQQVEEFKERTARKVRDLRCPVHGQSPRLRFHGASLRDMTIQMSSCCDRLIGLANHQIAQQ